MRKQVVAFVVLALVSISVLHAETYRYLPTALYYPAAGGVAVLKMKAGDRVITATVDDQGAGADGKALADAHNPQTGPFFIEGAEPGDLLVVTIERLDPNRTTGYSTSDVSSRAIAAGALSGRPDPARLPWTIDKAAGLVRLDLPQIIPNTDWASRFAVAAFSMPLKPMLSSIGVAPPAGVAPLAGPFGGNLSTADITSGTRVMLPVYQPGALLY